ncbi:MAG: hypothetical protein HKM04_08905 [Legionellales bacterium]|nr:hypothetical protein [Legionellales bacterium]
MKKFLTYAGVLLISLFFFVNCFAELSAVDLNSGQDTPNYFTSLGNSCPRSPNCDYNSNFIKLSDANRCGCCSCHGGAIGCAGGAVGQIVCGDGTYAEGCNCQYLVNNG